MTRKCNLFIICITFLTIVSILQITIQGLQGFQAGAQGHLLLKTENGQFQLLRVQGPTPTAGTPGTVTTNSMAGNTVVATPGAMGTTTYRLASLPAVSRLNAQFTGQPLATIRKPIQVTHIIPLTETRSSLFVEVLLVSVQQLYVGMPFT